MVILVSINGGTLQTIYVIYKTAAYDIMHAKEDFRNKKSGGMTYLFCCFESLHRKKYKQHCFGQIILITLPKDKEKHLSK